MELTIPWNEFNESIISISTKGTQIEQKHKRINNQEELELFSDQFDKWNTTTQTYLEESFSSSQNFVAKEFKFANSNNYNVSNQNDIDSLIKKKLQALNQKIRSLNTNRIILSVCDSCTNPNETLKAQRAKMNVNDVLELILTKLYDLYDDNLYPIKQILAGNYIQPKRYGEELEMLNILNNQDLIDLNPIVQNPLARISVNGKIYVEELQQPIKSDYSKIENSIETINKKIDEIFESIKNLGFGQEIIFDSLDELRDLSGKLTKRNWGELLKGKVIDLVLQKLIPLELASHIFEELTSEVLRIRS